METKLKNALKLGLVRANKLKLRILNECEENRVTLRMCLRQGREQDAAKVASTIVMGIYRTEALMLVVKYMTTLSSLSLANVKAGGESDSDLKAVVQSLVFSSSPYFPELPELAECKQILVATLGGAYFSEANMRCVDPILIAYASVYSTHPDPAAVRTFVHSFAKENHIDISSLPLFSPQASQQPQSTQSLSSSAPLPTPTPTSQKGERDKDELKKLKARKTDTQKTFSFFGRSDSAKRAKGKVDPSKCVFVKESLKDRGIVGIPTRFKVAINDSTGAPCTKAAVVAADLQSDAAKVHILVSGPEGRRIVGSYTDNKDGSLTGEFVPPVAGTYAIAVYCGGVLLGGNALMQDVRPQDEMRKTDPAKCTVAGQGLENPVANDLAVFTVTAVDAMGDRRPAGADRVSMLISGPSGEHIVGDVDDNGDGTYTASFLPTRKGTYAIAFYCENSLVGNNGKPFTVDFDKDITEVAGVTEIMNYDNVDEVTKMGASKVDERGEVENGNDDDDVIELESEEDSTNPDITTEPMLCIVDGKGSDGGVAQETQVFTIRAVNSEGKQRRRGGDRFRVFISGPDDLRIRGKVHDLGNGTYTAAYTPPVEGLYNIAIYMGTVPVGEGKPIQVEVKGSGGGGDGKKQPVDDDDDDLELMKRFKVLHDPLNSVQDKPGYLEKKKKSAERLKKK